MDQAQQDALREPFAPEQIGKLPAVAGKRPELDYVGHAAVTDRLLKVDPEWNWEPLAVGPDGLPLLKDGGLWIKLTIAGVTRLGYGDQTNGKGMKEVIGDGIRNAAMRFGVALDLWSKQPLLDAGDEVVTQAGDRRPARQPAPATTSKKVPTNWKELLDHYNESFYAHPWPEWWAEAAAAFYSLRIETTLPFNGVVAAIEEAKGKEGVKDFWQRLLKTADAIPTSDLGPVRSDVRKGFAANFDGAVLFGPHVSMSPEEATDYPTFDMYKAGDLRPAAEAAQEAAVEEAAAAAPPEPQAEAEGEPAPVPGTPLPEEPSSAFVPPAGATEEKESTA